MDLEPNRKNSALDHPFKKRRQAKDCRRCANRIGELRIEPIKGIETYMKTLNRIFSFSQPFYCALGLLLLASAVQANEWIITDTVQNGSPGAVPGDPDAPTLGMVLWFTNGINGGGSDAIYGQGTGPGYACYGLINPTASCVDDGQTEIWMPNPAVYSGTVNDDPNAPTLNLSWTGQAGSKVTFGMVSLFTSSILSGSYDAAGQVTGTDPGMPGYDTNGFSCWNDPLVPLPGPPDFCGNGTGNPFTVPASGPQTIASRALPGGLVSVIDHMDGTITINMQDTTFTDCLADVACTPDSNSNDVFAQWTVNADLLVVGLRYRLFESNDIGNVPRRHDHD